MFYGPLFEYRREP